MFEAVVMLCLAGAGEGPCREALLPGYEAASSEACEAALAMDPPAIENLAPDVAAPRCAPVGEMLSVTEIAPGVFVHRGKVAEPDFGNRGDVSNLGFVIGDASVAVIDSGSARWMGEALWRSIRNRTDLPVSHVILTHSHPDHVFGATVLAEAGAKVTAHADLPRALADRQANYTESFGRLIGPGMFLGTAVPHVTATVDDRAEIDIGNRILAFRAWSPAHSGADLTVLDRTTGTLFAGDLVFDEHTPALDGKLTGWIAVLAEIAQMDVARVIPGHGGPSLAWPEGARPIQRYLGTLAADTRAAIDTGERLGEAVNHIAVSEANNWDLFEAYNKRNATVAFTELEWE